MAGCPECKAAIDCTGFLYSVDKAVDLIINDKITDPEAIEAFNEMKLEMESAFRKWVDKYVEF